MSTKKMEQIKESLTLQAYNLKD